MSDDKKHKHKDWMFPCSPNLCPYHQKRWDAFEDYGSTGTMHTACSATSEAAPGEILETLLIDVAQLDQIVENVTQIYVRKDARLSDMSAREAISYVFRMLRAGEPHSAVASDPPPEKDD